MSKADTKEHLEHLEDTGSPNSIHEVSIDDLDSIEQTETGKFSWLISITAAIGGMLFGYDTGIISAVLVCSVFLSYSDLLPQILTWDTGLHPPRPRQDTYVSGERTHYLDHLWWCFSGCHLCRLFR